MADVNGDGKDELVVDNVYFKQGYTGGTRYTLSQFDRFHTYMIGDVDGDGCFLADSIYFSETVVS